MLLQFGHILFSIWVNGCTNTVCELPINNHVEYYWSVTLQDVQHAKSKWMTSHPNDLQRDFCTIDFHCASFSCVNHFLNFNICCPQKSCVEVQFQNIEQLMTNYCNPTIMWNYFCSKHKSPSKPSPINNFRQQSNGRACHFL